MADLADMIYGTAQNAAQDVGQGIPQGLQAGAQLALQKEQLDQHQQMIQQKMQELQQEKLQRGYQFLEDAGKYDQGGARNNYLKAAASYFQSMGIPEQQIPYSTIDGMKYDDNVGRMVTLNNRVREGSMTPQDRDSIVNNPQSFADVPVTPANIGKFSDADVSQTTKDWLAEEQTKAKMRLEQANADKVAALLKIQMQKENELERHNQAMEGIGQQKADTGDARVAAQTKALEGKASLSAEKQTQTLLTSARGDSSYQQAQKDIYSADKALAITNKIPDLNNVNPQMAKLVVSEVAKIAQGGVPTMGEMGALTPETLSSRFAGIVQQMNADPTPANVGAFLKQYMDYAKDLKEQAKSQVRARQNRIINSNGSLTSESKDRFIDNFVKPFAADRISFNGHDWSPQELQDKIKMAPQNDPKIQQAMQALREAGY